MKKILIACSAIALVAAAVAVAAQVNTYSVTASTSPTKAGTKKKPVPIALSFNYTVGEQSNQRPSPVKQYKITFTGVKVTQTGLATCTADQINAAQGDDVCPSSAIVGSGSIDNEVGASADPSGKAACHFDLTIYNGKAGHNTLFIGQHYAHKTGKPDQTCVGTPVHNAIDGQYVQTSKDSTLQFTVPPALLHPAPGIDVAVTNVTSKINKIFVGKGHKKTGYYASFGGCVKHKRTVTVTFVSEAGQSTPSSTTAKCS